MWDTFQELTNVSTFTWVALLFMTGSICGFLKVIIEAPGLALLFGPFIVLGGLISTHYFDSQSISFSPDRHTNAATEAAIGVLAALILLLVLYIVWARVSDARLRARKAPDALSDPSAH